MKYYGSSIISTTLHDFSFVKKGTFPGKLVISQSFSKVHGVNLTNFENLKKKFGQAHDITVYFWKSYTVLAVYLIISIVYSVLQFCTFPKKCKDITSLPTFPKKNMSLHAKKRNYINSLSTFPRSTLIYKGECAYARTLPL